MKRRRGNRSYAERTVESLLGAMERAQRAERSAASGGLLQRVDPRVKVAGVLALVAAVVFARNAAVMAAILAAAILAALASRLRVRTMAAGAWLQAFLFTAVIAAPALFLTRGDPVFSHPLLPWRVTAQGLRSAGYLLVRVTTAVTLAYLLVATTPWPHILKALRVFRVPAVVVLVLGMTYRYILLLLEAAREMFEAHRARGAGRAAGTGRARQVAASAAVLFSKTMALGDEVYLAMQARGFRGEVHLLDDFRMTRGDWGAALAFAAAAGAAAWMGR